MTPDDIRHGTYAGAQQHWRDGDQTCDPCRAAVRRYQKRLKYDTNHNDPRKVDATRAREHARQLMAAGMTDRDIAKRAGISLTAARSTRAGLNQTVLTATADAILGVTLAPGGQGWVSDIGSRRRIQALRANGWSRNRIAEAGQARGHNLTPSVVSWVVQGRATEGRVRVTTRDAIAAAYDHLSMQIAPPGRSSSKVKSTATGYPMPLAWNNIDDPDEQPAAACDRNRPHHSEVDPVVVDRILAGDWRLRATRAERASVIAQWDGSRSELSRLTGWAIERYAEDVSA